jgi:hypothetical protein
MLATLHHALNTALTEIFVVVCGITIIALIANFFLKGIPRHTSMKGKLVTKAED